MTEAEWLACADPTPMLEFLRGKASDRKLRLFAVACCRSVWHLLTDKRSGNAIEVAEKFADGEATGEAMRMAWAEAVTAAKTAMWVARQAEGEAKTPTENEARAAWEAAWGAKQTAGFVIKEGGAIAKKAWPEQADFFHDIFGNSFHSISFDPAWQTLTVKHLAQTIYTDRTFDQMPILADDLEKAGCDNQEILGHCRGPGPHVRGCWVVDLVLGKE